MVSRSNCLTIVPNDRNKDAGNMNKVNITQEKVHAKKPHITSPYSIKYMSLIFVHVARLQVSEK